MNRFSALGAACVLVSLMACSSTPTTAECTGAASCPTGASCVDGRCVVRLDAGVVAMPDAARADARGPLDAGSVDAGSNVGLGRRCGATAPCPTGLRCLEGACRLDCGGAPSCGTPEVCCAAAEVCSASGCAPVGAPCTPAPGCGGEGVRTCQDGQYCDALLMRCLPSPTTAACTVPPPTGAFTPELAWEWTGSTQYPTYKGVLVTPMVADINHDGASDVLVIAYDETRATGTVSGEGILCALSGPGNCAGQPRELFCTDPAGRRLNSWGHIAVADLDATDGVNRLTIIAGLRGGALASDGIAAFSETGEFLWEGRTAAGAPVNVFMYGGAPAIADLDGDGTAEIVVGGTVFDHTGRLEWSSATAHVGNAGFGAISIAVDLDANGSALEVVTGNTAYESNGTPRWTSTAIGDGYPAVADFDRDGRPEVVVVENGRVAVLRANGTPYVPTFSLGTLTVDGAAVTGRGGAPTVSDLDGDGRPEIGLALANAYVVLKVTTTPAIQLGWTRPVNDASSNITASAMFDFDGNGVAEVVYQDTCRTRVFAGSDGATLLDIDNSSGTASNYPTVADLNGDGRAEFILVADSYYARAFPGSSVGCPAGMMLRDGVRVFRDANDAWQSTRAIWNQHTYHVSNVCDGVDAACSAAENRSGAIPRRETASWTSDVNGYRINARFGAPQRNAPDLVPLAVAADVSACPVTVTLRADIGNRGSSAVAAGTRVSFYEGDPAGAHTLLGTSELLVALPPGGVARVTLVVPIAASGRSTSLDVYVIADDDGMGRGRYRECNETNNTSVPLDVACIDLL